MDHCIGFDQNSFFTRCEEKIGLVCVLDRKDFVACPRPRRVSLLSQSSPTSLRCEIRHQTDLELLDLLLVKDDLNKEPPQYAAPRLASSPPFFAGSPPSRVSNPLIQDARFMSGINPFGQLLDDAPPLDLPYPVSSAKKVNVKDTTGSGAARVEGFDILSTEQQVYHNTSVSVRVEGFDIRRGNGQIPRVEGVLNRGGRVEGLDRGRGNSRVSAAA